MQKRKKIKGENIMYDINLKVGDKIKYVGNEQLEYFTFGNVYEVQSIKSLGYLGKEMHIMVIDDANEENYITVPFFKNNFRKVSVTITTFDDDTFVTETDIGMLNWNNYNYTLELLLEILDSLEIGYEIVSTSTEF
jgi:hypothetical protein